MARTLPVLAFFLALLAGCTGDVPHTNPLDPLSGLPAEGGLRGQVLSVVKPARAVAAANVIILPQDPMEGTFREYRTTTGSDGTFSIPELPVGRYRIEVAKEGYTTDVDTISVRLGRMAELPVLEINGIPDAQVLDLYSERRARSWTTSDQYMIRGRVKVQDPDGVFDIKTVWLEIPGLNVADTLTRAEADEYLLVLDAPELPSRNLYDVVGRPMHIRVRDGAGTIYTSPPVLVERIFESTPEIMSPANFSQTSNNYPTLYWRKLALPFKYVWRVALCEELDNTTCRETPNMPRQVPSNLDSLAVELALRPGTYRWEVSAVDEFGNLGRSYESKFQVE